MTLKHLTLGAALLALAACSQAKEAADTAAEKTAEVAESTTETVKETVAEVMAPSAQLGAILDAQSDDHKARHDARHPAKTLAFFGVEPGMTVAEVLPGGGWYSKILLPYLGDEGHLIGIDYSVPMWSEFGGFATEEFINNRKTWSEQWTGNADEWRAGSEADISAFPFGSMPDDLKGTADAVLMTRAFHHLTRFDRAFLQESLDDMKMILKPGGIVGIVQHRGPEDLSDEWANGDNGYMKQSEVIKIMEGAGFELVGESEINANPKDKPTADDAVWRLPPTLGTSREDEELKAKMTAIGETDRMTLKFRLK